MGLGWMVGVVSGGWVGNSLCAIARRNSGHTVSMHNSCIDLAVFLLVTALLNQNHPSVDIETVYSIHCVTAFTADEVRSAKF